MKLTGFMLLFISLFAASETAFSQVQVLKKWTEEESADNVMAYFVYRDSDQENLDDLEKVISKVWTLSKIELISIDEYLSLETKKGDFTMLMGITHDIYYSQNGVASNFVNLYLDVRVQSDVRQEILGRISLAPNGQTIYDVCRGPESLEKVIYSQYKTDANFSWNYAYISAGLATVVDALTEGKLITEIKDDVKNPELATIKSAVLFVGDAVNTEQNRFSGKDSYSDQKDAIAKAYLHKFEIASDKTINEKFINNELEYLFMCQKFGKGKYLIVINVKENRIIYTRIEKGRYNFSAKDLKELSARMGK
ncbi:MAG: hypothetical protein ACO1N0_08745 [Fluviicola sp.]